MTILLLLFRFIDSLLTLDLVVTTTFGGPGFRTHTLSSGFTTGPALLQHLYAAATSWLLLLACLVLAALLLAWRRRAMRVAAVRAARRALLLLALAAVLAPFAVPVP